MADRLAGLRLVDPALTNLARGYRNGQMVAEELFPIVGNLEKEAGVYPQFSKEAFYLYATERGIRANSNRVNPAGITPLTYNMTEHDLEYPIDYREDEEAIFPLQAHATNVVTSAIQLRREKLAADLAQNTANYASGNKLTLAGDDCWSEPGSDPVGVIEDGKEQIRATIAQYPNTAVIGPKTLKALKKHPALIERIKYSMKGVLTIELLQEIFDIPKIIVGRMVYSTDAGVVTDIWSDNMVMAYVPEATSGQERTMYEPSFGYTFRKKDRPIVDKYTPDGGKIQLIRATDLFDIKMPGAEGGYLVFNTVK